MRGCPLKKVKSELLTYLLSLKSPPLNKREVFFECGLLHYFSGKWLKAATFFALSHRVIANYYLGECHFKLDNFPKAKYHFKMFLKKAQRDSPTTHFTRFKLAEIAYQEKRYRESYSLLLKSQYQGLERNILLYRIYEKTSDADLKKEVVSILKTKYKDDVKIKPFLEGVK